VKRWANSATVESAVLPRHLKHFSNAPLSAVTHCRCWVFVDRGRGCESRGRRCHAPGMRRSAPPRATASAAPPRFLGRRSRWREIPASSLRHPLQSAGEAQRKASWPRSQNRSARPRSGSMSPRVPSDVSAIRKPLLSAGLGAGSLVSMVRGRARGPLWESRRLLDSVGARYYSWVNRRNGRSRTANDHATFATRTISAPVYRSAPRRGRHRSTDVPQRIRAALRLLLRQAPAGSLAIRHGHMGVYAERTQGLLDAGASPLAAADRRVVRATLGSHASQHADHPGHPVLHVQFASRNSGPLRRTSTPTSGGGA